MTSMTKDELVKHLMDSGYSLEAAELATKDTPEEHEGKRSPSSPSNGHEAMNDAIRGARGHDVHGDAPANRSEMNDEIRRAAGRAPEQEEDR